MTSIGWVTKARIAVTVLVAATVLALALALAAGARAAEPRMKIDPRLRVATVCFPVTDPLGRPRVLYGKRYSIPSATTATPAIVLVHGIASSTATWDLTPTWSTARALATAGYVAYSYDRLGYARSPYFDVPGGGATLTTEEHRRMLHQVVGDVHTGGYGVPARDDCGAAGPPAGRAGSNARVAILGHSAGGWVVAGYPGTYHDVAAMIQTSIFATTDGAAAPSSQSSQGGNFTPDLQHPDYFDFFQTRADCEAFNLYRPGIVASAVAAACAPPFIPSPFGEIADLPAKLAIDDAAIAQIGPSIPVLIAAGDHDTTAPPEKEAADFAYYRAHCGCDVTRATIPSSGHLYQAHASLQGSVDAFVRWLSSRGIRPTPGR